MKVKVTTIWTKDGKYVVYNDIILSYDKYETIDSFVLIDTRESDK